jgi:hypothetical protein
VLAVAPLFTVSVPPEILKALALVFPAMVRAPLLSSAVPAPVRLAPVFRVYVPPANCSVEPEATVNVPLLVPPPVRTSVPLCTSTVPVFVRGTPTDVTVPAPVFTNWPALTNEPTAPWPTKSASVPTCSSPVLVFSRVAPVLIRNTPVPLTVSVPALLSVRASIPKVQQGGAVTARVPPAATVVCPLPSIPPSVHVYVPLLVAMVKVPAPVKIPPEKVPPTVLAVAPLFTVSVPPLRFVLPVTA